jgi:hypothetical protein
MKNNILKENIQAFLEKKGVNRFAPNKNNDVLVFLDDINLNILQGNDSINIPTNELVR